ncbi:hypothetical protein M413DRAFT_28080 [Hebeloma cylindrosporum]|uniref:YTH domain-containing protein n=1 Tax=Hebeloma cylindrosporum TaxID=76867 RepID=A0A0C2XTH1_HEBCY|nr:hypothetical protein M413DRAFT_28080 [Hebeloma cylindrosporum h7]
MARRLTHFFLGPDLQTASDSMGDDSQGPPPDQARPGSSRRRSRSQQIKSYRSSGSHPPPGYGAPATNPTESIQHHRPDGFQGSSLQYPTLAAASPYTQRPGYNPPYAMTTPTPPSYGFPHSYHHPDQRNVQANYPPMLQPPVPVFPYQRLSLEVTSAPPFTGNLPHPVNPASPPFSGQGVPLSPSYVSPSSSFHSLQYPPPVTTPPYAFPPSFPQSPMYQPPFRPSPYGQHYTPTPTGETESQGTWYYLPRPSQSPYDQAPSYQGHYSVNYPQLGASEMSYSAPPSSSARPSSSTYSLLPSKGFSHQSQSDNHIPSDSSRASAVDPRTQSRANSVSSGSGRHQPISDRPVIRRSYHPNPPAHRSEWVMWAGNVPSDATHDELWRFFNAPPESRVKTGESSATGVLSIFLISRSSCVFVNYESEACLHEAISRFNGVPVRPYEPRCPRLVCRVRRKDDDLKAGVGGQRGMGMHTRWIQAQKGKARGREQTQSDKSTSDEPSTSPSIRSGISEQLASPMASLSLSSDEDGKRPARPRYSSSSGSFASTNSSFLTKYFPERYFILKSLTQEDLDISVSRGVWATQKHNEEILDQAFRTSKRVNLIFGVNKSGEFYGYARMSGPVLHGERRVSWASRSSSHHSSSSSSGLHPPPSHPPIFFSPGDHRLVDASPLPVDAPTSDGRLLKSALHQADGHIQPSRPHQTAPAVIGQKYHLPTLITPATKYSLDQFKATYPESVSSDSFELDASAPARAMRSKQGSSSSDHVVDGGEKSAGPTRGPTLEVVDEEEERRAGGEPEVGEDATTKEQEPSWGDSFAVEWISTKRVPFHRTRHLRNPWNNDREVKVSRDGTELEPSVGKRLLDEWDKLADLNAPLAVVVPKSTSAGKRRLGAKNTPSLPPPPEGGAITEGGGGGGGGGGSSSKSEPS